MSTEYLGEFNATPDPTVGIFLPKFARTERVLRDERGRPVKVTVDDSGTVMQIEDDDHQHAVVAPAAIRVPMPLVSRQHVRDLGGDPDAPTARFVRPLRPTGE